MPDECFASCNGIVSMPNTNITYRLRLRQIGFHNYDMNRIEERALIP